MKASEKIKEVLGKKHETKEEHWKRAYALSLVTASQDITKDDLIEVLLDELDLLNGILHAQD